MYLYKDCSDLPIRNFTIIYQTNDFRYLVVGWDRYEDIEVPKEANERWQYIRNEWAKMISDNTTYNYYNLILEVAYLRTRYSAVKILLDRIIIRENMDDEMLSKYAEGLAEWRYKWNKKASKQDNIIRLYKQLKQSENKLSLKTDELESLKKSAGEKEEDAVSLEKQRLIIEQSLGVKIDLDKDSVKTWVEACKMHEQLSEKRAKVNGK